MAQFVPLAEFQRRQLQQVLALAFPDLLRRFRLIAGDDEADQMEHALRVLRRRVRHRQNRRECEATLEYLFRQRFEERWVEKFFARHSWWHQEQKAAYLQEREAAREQRAKGGA